MMRIRIESGFYIFLAVLLLTVPLRWIIALFAAMLTHELGHYLMVYLLGGQVVGGTVGLRGARLEALPMPAEKELLAVLAGPAASLLLLSVCRVFPRVALCGLFQGVYNLIPLYPLDGGKAVRCLRVMRKEKAGNLQRHGNTSCKAGKQRVQ